MTVDDTSVTLTQREFAALDEWDTELPPDRRVGRKWKRRVREGTAWTERFEMGEFVGQGKGRPVKVVWRVILEIT